MGLYQLIESKPKPQTHLWASGQCCSAVHYEEGIQCSFYCACVLSRNLMMQNEKEVFIIAVADTPLPSSGAVRDCMQRSTQRADES